MNFNGLSTYNNSSIQNRFSSANKQEGLFLSDSISNTAHNNNRSQQKLLTSAAASSAAKKQSQFSSQFASENNKENIHDIHISSAIYAHAKQSSGAKLQSQTSAASYQFAASAQQALNNGSSLTSNFEAHNSLADVRRKLSLVDNEELSSKVNETASKTQMEEEQSNEIKCESSSSSTSSSIIACEDIFREISQNVLGKSNMNATSNIPTSLMNNSNNNNMFARKSTSDRFIPSRVGSETFSFFVATTGSTASAATATKSSGLGSNGIDASMDSDSSFDPLSNASESSSSNMREEQSASLYTNLLQAHFMGSSSINASNNSVQSMFGVTSQASYSAEEDYFHGIAGNMNQQRIIAAPTFKKLFSYGDENSMNSYGSSCNGNGILGSQSTLLRSNSSYFEGLLGGAAGCGGSMSNVNAHLEMKSSTRQEKPMKINPKPYKILEAPTLKNDFYLNLLDWSPSNLVSVGLENYVYVLSGANQSVKTQFTIPEYVDPSFIQNDHPERTQLQDYYNMVCSVGWSQRTDQIAVGDRQGKTYLFDLAKNKFLRIMHNHAGRVGQIAWNGNLIATGSRDKTILVADIRDKSSSVMTFRGHKQEICGMRWSFDEQTLASGGNDNKVFLWSLKMGGRLAKISQSRAAVKAIGFSPHQHNILAFGGGTADRCIRIYDTQQLKQIDCIDTGSQVCNLIFSKNSKQIISTHGYSLNQIIVWNQANMKKVATLTGHSQRVLYLAESPCGQNILTGAADETIRFWNIFKSSVVNELSPNSLGLR